MKPRGPRPLRCLCAFTRETKAAITVVDADVPDNSIVLPPMTATYIEAANAMSGYPRPAELYPTAADPLSTNISNIC